MRLYLITHAHTQQEPAVDAARWRLSEAGREQAAALAREPFWAEVDRVVLSSEPKTRLTVEPALATRDLPLTVDARFNELHRPGWVGDYVGRVAHCFAHPHQAAVDWEPASEALARFRAGMVDLHTQFPKQTLALIGHGLTLSLYRAHLLNQYVDGAIRVRLADWRALAFAAVALVEGEADRAVLRQDFASTSSSTARA